MSYVADTHAVLWYLFPGPRRLGPTAQAAFEECDEGNTRIIIPAVVLTEMIAVVEKGRLPNATLPALLAQVREIQASTNYRFLSLRPQIVIASHKLTAIPDIFDRLIVAECLRLGFPLITRDQLIADSRLVPTVW